MIPFEIEGPTSPYRRTREMWMKDRWFALLSVATPWLFMS